MPVPGSLKRQPINKSEITQLLERQFNLPKMETRAYLEMLERNSVEVNELAETLVLLQNIRKRLALFFLFILLLSILRLLALLTRSVLRGSTRFLYGFGRRQASFDWLSRRNVRIEVRRLLGQGGLGNHFDRCGLLT